jgi:hypothetical protein
MKEAVKLSCHEAVMQLVREWQNHRFDGLSIGDNKWLSLMA